MSEKNTKNEKRYGLLLFFTLFFWTCVALIVWRVDPEMMKNFLFPGVYLPMLTLLYVSIFLTLSILFLSAKVAFRWATGIVLYILLRLLGLGTLLNGIMLVGIMLSLEIYLKEKTV